MIPADLSALAPRGGKGSVDGRGSGDGAASGGLGALFGDALDGLAGRRKGPDGGSADAPGGGRETGDGDGEVPRHVRGEPAFRSLAAALERALPIRAGALALQGSVDPQAEPEPPAEDGEASAEPASDAAERLLATLAGANAAPAVAKVASAKAAEAPAAARAPTALPGAGDSDAPLDGPDLPAPKARGAAFMLSNADLSLATKAEPSVGMALKATVVSQATHLPPALGAANLAALVDAAASLLSEGEPKGRASLAFAPDLGAASAAAKAQPVKVLTVQLQPVSLGTVTIALRMTADGVAMEITAADAKAAALLRRDEKLIVDAVRRSGLAGEVVAIHTADGPRAANGSQSGGSDAAGNGHSQAGDGQTKHGGESGRGAERGGPEQFSLERRSDDDQPSGEGAVGRGSRDGSRGDGVYL